MADSTTTEDNVTENSNGLTNTDEYVVENVAATPDLRFNQGNQDNLDKIASRLYNGSGYGQFSTFQDSLHGFDNIKNTLYMPEREGHGFTFFTRPKLNLSTPSLRQDRVLVLLDTLEPQSVAFAIRAYLDSSIVRRYGVATEKSQYLNHLNPFIPILSNRLLQLNGWPDPTLDVETTAGGYFSESITYPKGSDMLARNYDISATFNDIQGSVIYNIFSMWLRWIALATRGHVTAYVEDIEARRMSFTSGMYRFVMDPSNRYITKWAKATGCYPRSVPSGSYFNYDVNSGHVDTAMNLSIPMTVAGRIEYNDPIIFREFNMLIEKYNPGIKSYTDITTIVEETLGTAGASLATGATMYGALRTALNFNCVPYIDTINGTNELQWRFDRDKVDISSILRSFGSYDD